MQFSPFPQQRDGVLKAGGERMGQLNSIKLASLGVQRKLLWERRDNIVEPFGETVQQVFARVSAMRDRLDGPQVPRRPLNIVDDTKTSD